MSQEIRLARGWTRLAGAAGLASSLVYPLLVFVPLPTPAQAALAGAWGLLLGAASLGLGRLLELDRRSIAARLGALANALAGALVVAMLHVQIAVGERAGAERPSREIVGVWLGLDVAWDVYIGAGTALFAFAMLRHPRFGQVWGGAGLAVAALLLGLNLATFPAPPGEAGLFDAGPLVGLWYLAVSLRAWSSAGWAARRAAELRPA